jgi:mono/diheme cytochrome c family protein
MNRDSGRKWWTEGWAFLAVAILAFVGGFLVGDLGSSPEKETVYVSTTPGAEEEAESPEEGATETGAAEQGAGAQIFADNGCGSCHTLTAAGSTGTIGPDLNESLASDDDTAGIEVMIAEPNAEVVEGYSPNVMPQDYGKSLSKAEIHELAEYLVENTPAMP